MWVFNPPSFRADPIGSVFTIRVEGEDDVGLVEFEFESKFSNVLLLLGEGCSLEFGLDLDLGCDMVSMVNINIEEARSLTYIH